MSERLVEALLVVLRPTIEEIVEASVERHRAAWRWRTAEQVAELLDITPDAVRTRVRRGQLPGAVRNGRVYIDMVAWDEQLQQDAVLP